MSLSTKEVGWSVGTDYEDTKAFNVGLMRELQQESLPTGVWHLDRRVR